VEFGNLITIKEKSYQIKKGIRKKMKTHENKTCLLYAYCPTPTIICKVERGLTTTCRFLIVTTYHIYNTCKPFVAIAYCLQCMQTLCNYCVSSIARLPSLQTSNLMFTPLLLLSNGHYCHVAKCIFYSKTKIEGKYIFNFIEEKKN